MESYRTNALVPCCHFCNDAKATMSETSFLQFAKNVVGYQDNHLAAILPIKPRKQKVLWREFVRGASRIIEIDESHFLLLQQLPCHHCGYLDPNGSGFDRYRNDEIYSLANSYPCCWPCNNAKKNYPAEYFYKKCRFIVAHQSK